ncbi:hypothetical protein AAHC03_013225 [Spirometra sp. Aus1]
MVIFVFGQKEWGDQSSPLRSLLAHVDLAGGVGTGAGGEGESLVHGHVMHPFIVLGSVAGHLLYTGPRLQVPQSDRLVVTYTEGRDKQGQREQTAKKTHSEDQ